MPQEELEAIKACQKGDKEAFGRLYDAYIRKIYDFIYFKTNHRETAEDLTSAVFSKALVNLDRFSPDKGTFQAWLYQIARNTVIDHYRTQKKAANIEDVWDLASDDDIARDLDTRAKLVEIEKYLGKLKSEQRDLVIMRVWQELSYEEIAAITGKSEASLKMAFSRTMAKLREAVPLAILLWLGSMA